MTKKNTFIPFFLLILSVSLLYTPPLWAASKGEINIRGIEREEKHITDLDRQGATALLYLPKQFLNGTLWGIGKTASVVSDPEFIEKVEDILYIYERKLAWFPIVDYNSGFRPGYGVGLYLHGRLAL